MFGEPKHIIGTWCDDPAHFRRGTRRDFLKVGFLSGVGLTLGDYFALQSAFGDEKKNDPAAQAVIQIFLAGGMSHIDTFDPKPDAPVEVRGELGTVKTNTGEYLGGLLKQTATVADKISIIRSFTHSEAAHERGTHNMLTGYRPSPAVVYPAMGSIVSHEFEPRNNLPPYICVPNASNGYLGTGYLSSAYGPFSLGDDPARKGFAVRDLSRPADVDEQRFARRRSMLETVDAHFRALEQADVLDAMNSFYQRAYSLISSKQAREAFNIDAEDGKIRDEYGRNSIGQQLLMARRLVQAGARFVTITYGGWDHHKGIKGALSGRVPALDQAFATLIRDLERRGMLSRTLVALTSEFGRTPRLNRDAGRDHWPKVFSIVLAGGGLKGGQIVGRSDPGGAEVADRPLGPADMAATIFTQLGIDPHKQLMSAGNRPLAIVRDGRAIEELL